MAFRSVVKLQPEAANRLWRSLCSYGGPTVGAVDEASREFIKTKTKNDFKREILELKHPIGCATTVLRRWADNGREVSSPELRRFSAKLLKLNRFNHALQVSEISLIFSFYLCQFSRKIIMCAL